jgi:hypothetical protein
MFNAWGQGVPYTKEGGFVLMERAETALLCTGGTKKDENNRGLEPWLLLESLECLPETVGGGADPCSLETYGEISPFWNT